MKRKLIFGLVAAILLVNLAIGAQIYLASQTTATNDLTDTEDPNVQVYSDVLEKIRREYVDGTNVTYQQLVYSSIEGMVNKLDPHSEFLDASAYQRLQDDTEGQFGGLGLIVALKNGFVTVVTPMDDTPGFRAGILTGDRIIKVSGQSVTNSQLDDVVKELRGDPDTEITLTIQRPSSGMVKDFTLKRAIIQMAMVKDISGKQDFPVDANQIGYVQITQFGDQTSDELERALQKMKGEGMQALVLDLRWNPGGLLDEAVGVCQKFLPRGELVVSTEGRDTLEKYYSRGNGDELPGMPIVVLANLNSASAAEIVTGCLQDRHRAVVMGEKTFGKGSVQTIFPLADGSALKLTVAKYYTPSHKVIHEHGITPDIFVPLTDTQEAALLFKRSPGGMESLSDNEREAFEKIHDTQLERADDLLRGLLIYGTMNGATKPEKVAAK